MSRRGLGSTASPRGRTSRCSAASAVSSPPSPRCFGTRASRSRWLTWVACSGCRRWSMSWPGSGCSTTRAATSPWPGSSWGPAGGAGIATSRRRRSGRSGVMRELETAGTRAAAGARRNLLNLIDHVAAFAPVEGEATLSTLVAYLDAAEETEDDLEPAQPSEANTVKLLTVHKAKGLEWPVVFVPGLATGPRSGIFPDLKGQAGPGTRPDVLPFELRGDADVFPAYEGNIKAFRDALGERAIEDERRLCYVALTRARDALVVS